MNCPVCCSTYPEDLISLRQIPVLCNVLWPTAEAAQTAPRGDMQLMFCRACGHVFNAAFEPALMAYSPTYENSLHHSPRFQHYAEELAHDLVERHNLRDKDIIDIGCGKGEFLSLLCEMGENRGLGFDPSYVPGPNVSPRLQVVLDYYSEQYADRQADFVMCRHVLEHIAEPVEFLKHVRRSIGNRLETVVFFEVPNVLYTLRDMGIWDLIYEHVSYFSASSLARLFSECDFDVYRVQETYGGQFLIIEARPSESDREGNVYVEIDDLADMATMSIFARAFAQRYTEKVAEWTVKLEQLPAQNRRAVVWGAGSKGATFLNVIRPASVEYAVDLNPRKHGMFVAGTGQRILPPDSVQGYDPHVVLVMNPLYEAEIRATLESFGLRPELWCV